MIASMLAGHATEQIVFDDVTTGARDDLKRATEIARKMVTEFGMSKRLGPQTYGDTQQEVFLGKDMFHQRNYSESIAQIIDEEVAGIIQDRYEVASQIIQKNRKKIDDIVDILIEKESLEGQEFEELFS